ncbi:MAG TPA: hypothetical protein VH134_03385 [Candidatus Dormibacteraeota bacterium]|nr:hypothetical protein [Candidatus Dormibacteraeota bacterium]
MRSARLMLAIGAVTALLPGCGSSSAISGLSAKDIVKLTSQKVAQQSLRADLSGRFVIDTSHLTGVSAAELQKLGAASNGYTLSGREDQESPKRLQLNVTLQPDYDNATIVVYDGQTFYSKDGRRFAAAGQLSSLTAGIGITPGDLTNYLGFLPDMKDLGSTTQDGIGVEHLQANIDQNVLDQVLGASVSSQGPNLSGLSDLFKQFITVKNGSLDIYVEPSTGNLDRVDMKLAFSFDFSKIGGLFGGASPAPKVKKGPNGTLDFDVAVGAHLHDYGAKITITKPTADPTAPKPPTGGLFGGLGT